MSFRARPSRSAPGSSPRRPLGALVIALAVLVAPGAALAQASQDRKTAPPPKPAAPIDVNNPNATTASYGDWVVRCATPAGQSEKVCEAATGIQVKVQGESRLLAQVVIGRAGKDQPTRLILQLPAGVFLPPGAALYLDDKAKTGIQTTYSMCPRGCFADATLDSKQLAELRAAKGPGRLEFVEGSRQRVAAPISFTGLSAALEAALK